MENEESSPEYSRRDISSWTRELKVCKLGELANVM